MYHYIKQSWKKPDIKTLRDRMIGWREGETIVLVDKPLRLDRARNLGYKDKKGVIVVRVRIKRGGRKRARPTKARKKGRTLTIRKTLAMSYQSVAEQRAARKFKNLEVLNSYWIGKDGLHYFFEVILIDPFRPEIKNDKNFKFLSERANRKRVFRGLTSSSKKSRN